MDLFSSLDLSPTATAFDPRALLRPYQSDVLDRARGRHKSGLRRGVVQGDTGCGKTFIMAYQTWLAIRMGKRVLIIAHRRRLVDQMIGTLSRFGIVAGVIMEGRPRTSSPVQVASRDTLRAMLRGSAGGFPDADLVLVDECHTSLSDEYRSVLGVYDSAFVTGYTATPVRPDGCTLAGYYQFLECVVPTSQLVAEGFLMPVECYDPEGIGRRRKKGEKAGISGDPVYHWRKFADGLPTVAFVPRIADSLALVERFMAAGIPAEHVDANTPEDERDDVIDRVQSGKTLYVSQVDVWTEGVDVPALACCQILRTCGSLRLFKQAVGRIMRPFDGNDSLPCKTRSVLIDHSGAVHEFGLPHADIVWTLDDADAIEKRAKKDAKEAGAVTCPECALVFKSQPTCPSCGHVMPRPKKKRGLPTANGDDDILTRFDGEAGADMAREKHNRLWMKSLMIAKHKNMTLRNAASIFKGLAKKWPWEVELKFIPPRSKEVWAMQTGEWLERQTKRAAG